MRWIPRPVQKRTDSRDSTDGLLGTPTGPGPGFARGLDEKKAGEHFGDKPVVQYGVVGFYIFAAVLMLTVNKWVLTSSPVPIFFALCQQTLAAALMYTSHLLGLLRLPPLRWSTAEKLWPLVALTVLGLAFNTLCLRHVDSGFYQTARGLLLPMTVMIAVWARVEPPNRRAVACCAVITVGYLVGATMDHSTTAARAGVGGTGVGVGEMAAGAARPQPTWRSSKEGIAIGFISSLTTAAHATVIKRSLPVVSGSTIHLAWYTNALSAVGLAPLVIVTGEIPLVWDILQDSDKLASLVIGTGITGAVGFFVCVAGFLSVKATSPVTHMVSSATRGVFQTGLSAWLYGDSISRPRIASIVMISLGSFVYALVNR